jgi:hypothetical protein
VRWPVLGLVVLTAGLASATSAGAAPRWSPIRTYDKPSPSCRCVSETAPRVAVNARGAAVATWVDGTHGNADRVRVALTGGVGRFGRAATLARGLRPFPAIAADGAVTVVWTGDRRLQFARRPAGATRFGRARTLARDADSAYAAAQADGSVVVVFESHAGLATRTISPRGVPGAERVLGRGGFGHDTVRVAPDGTLAACCVTPRNDDPNVPADTAEKVAVFRAAAGWQLLSADGLGDRDAIESVFADATDQIAGFVRVHTGGDAGVLGEPGFVRSAGASSLVAPSLVPGVKPTRGLAPSATIDGAGRSVLVYQEKARAEAFSREAPVYASLGAGRQRLDAGDGYQPAVRPLADGAIATWRHAPDRWRVAIEHDGRFRAAPVPSGRGPSYPGEDFSYNHDLATSGHHAVLAWTGRDGGVRVAELTA